jgi:hypothetical protein
MQAPSKRNSQQYFKHSSYFILDSLPELLLLRGIDYADRKVITVLMCCGIIV